ncbi:MAG: hypothetical protein ACLPN5_22580 [Roseiarcus sp.]
MSAVAPERMGAKAGAAPDFRPCAGRDRDYLMSTDNKMTGKEGAHGDLAGTAALARRAVEWLLVPVSAGAIANIVMGVAFSSFQYARDISPLISLLAVLGAAALKYWSEKNKKI